MDYGGIVEKTHLNSKKKTKKGGKNRREASQRVEKEYPSQKERRCGTQGKKLMSKEGVSKENGFRGKTARRTTLKGKKKKRSQRR